MFLMGQNPAVGAQNARLQRKALAKLKWFVVRDMVEIEPASFWHNSPEIERGELKTEEIETEVFFFPCGRSCRKRRRFHQHAAPAAVARKGGRSAGRLPKRKLVHSSARPATDRESKASDDPATSRCAHSTGGIRKRRKANRRCKPSSPRSMAGKPRLRPTANGGVWTHDREGKPHHGPQLDKYQELKDDGSTACGCWIYCGCYGSDGVNKPLRRQPNDYLGHGWGFAWPSDRRIIYNRASAAPDGKPWSERKKLVWWDPDKSQWTGDDVPDFKKDKSARLSAQPARRGLDRATGRRSFHHPRGRTGLALCSERFAGWADADALRTARVAGR